MPYDVFISHSSHDKPWVEMLARNLKQVGLRVFFDKWSITPGQSFVQELDRGLRESRKAVLICTAAARDSGWVREELDRLTVRRINEPQFSVIPVVIDADIPQFPFLQHINFVDFRDDSPAGYRTAFARLLSGLKDQEPGPHPSYDGLLEVPQPRPKPAPPSNVVKSCIETVFDRLFDRRGVVLVSQADRFSRRERQRLLDEAKRQFGADCVAHVAPPAGARSDTPSADEQAEYFRILGSQCGCDRPTRSEGEFHEAIGRRSPDARKFLLIVSGFEHGVAPLRYQFGTCLRALFETQPGFHTLVLGGEALDDLYFTDGDNSLFNFAHYETLPDIELPELQDEWQRRKSATAPQSGGKKRCRLADGQTAVVVAVFDRAGVRACESATSLRVPAASSSVETLSRLPFRTWEQTAAP